MKKVCPEALFYQKAIYREVGKTLASAGGINWSLRPRAVTKEVCFGSYVKEWAPIGSVPNG